MAAFTAPHYAAAQVGQTILEHGGTAIEAMVAAAASIAVVYPHMNGLGGDGFWIISEPGKAPIGIDASGVAAKKADTAFYSNFNEIPQRGSYAALTMAGAVSGWQAALNISHQWQPGLELGELLSPAIGQAKWGIEVTQSLQNASEKTYDELSKQPHFEQFLSNGQSLTRGQNIKIPNLADTLETLVEHGLDDFYRGGLAKRMAKDLKAAGSPIRLKDFQQHKATLVDLLSVKTSIGTLYNLPAPTQGIASLLILALYDKLKDKVSSDIDFIHLLVECTKRAFLLRDKVVGDPLAHSIDLSQYLTDDHLIKMADDIDMASAMPWPVVTNTGDTVWMGACDDQGRMVSYIQSLYWEFGSGVVLPQSGIVWNNRGTAFDLVENSLRKLKPGSKPFHTLNPAYALLDNGQRMVYGTMGGDGQPQTQAAIMGRYAYQNQSLDDAIQEGRWLLGRTWGDANHNLRIEQDLSADVSLALAKRGHDVLTVGASNELMGHAGAIVLNANGQTEAATDKRSDGRAFCDEC